MQMTLFGLLSKRKSNKTNFLYLMCGADHYLVGTMHMQMGACVLLWVAVQKWPSETRVNFNVIYHKYMSEQSGSVTCLAAGVFPCVFILCGSLLQTSLTKGSICVFKREKPFSDTALQIKCDTNTITYIKKKNNRTAV